MTACSRCQSRHCGLDGAALPSEMEPRFRGARGVSRSLGGAKAQLGCSKPVSPALLQEARAKLARRPVQSERPGPPAGPFAFCRVRTALWDKGRARGGLLGWASAVASPSAWPTLVEVSPVRLSAHRETFPRSGVSGESSRRGDVSEVLTAVWGPQSAVGATPGAFRAGFRAPPALIDSVVPQKDEFSILW